MRIAQVAPLYEAVPPRLYGGTERVVAYLTDALVAAGHEVTLFAAGDTHTRAHLVSVRDQSIRLDPAPLKSGLAAHLAMLEQVRERRAEFDVIHFHIDLLHYPFFADRPEQTLTTLHGRLDLKDLPEAYRRWPLFPLVSISNHQRGPVSGVNWLGTVYHGVPPRLYRCIEQPKGDYLAFVGRISPEKRLDRAIRIAGRSGMQLKIGAKVDAVDVDYFDQEIRPLLDTPHVEFLGEVSDAQKGALLGNAAALLFPIDWPEPFGLVMIEAMACGTPVIGWNCGSVPEVLDDGITGRIVDSEDAAVAAIPEVVSLDRRTIRAVFERRFSDAAMAQSYVELYWRLLADKGPRTRRQA